MRPNCPISSSQKWKLPTICLTWIQRRLPALMEFLDEFYWNAVLSLLCLLFNHSLSSGTVPSEWKSADVSPIHKKDNKEPASNHRPISLLPIISKVLKRCVCNRFYEHVRDMISKAQHGFLNGRSCVTQLLCTLHHIGQLLDNNIQTDVLFLDFVKAFDSVDYDTLLMKT